MPKKTTERDRAAPRQPAKPIVKRDPAATRGRILAAAIGEFSAKGFSGARIDAIARRSRANIRMIYHFFGGKQALYIVVLEHVLADLRAEELKLDFNTVQPLAGMLQLFDFIHGHFAEHPELINLLASENLNRGYYLKRSTRVPKMASPVVRLIEGLLARGRAQKMFRSDIDALQIYVAMVSLSYFHKSNAHTLSKIFNTDITAATWQARHKRLAQDMLRGYLRPERSGGAK